jgi:hypothetical protein
MPSTAGSALRASVCALECGGVTISVLGHGAERNSAMPAYPGNQIVFILLRKSGMPQHGHATATRMQRKLLWVDPTLLEPAIRLMRDLFVRQGLT